MKYLYYSCPVFIILMYQKIGVVEIAQDRVNHVESNNFIKIHIREADENINAGLRKIW